MLVRGVRWRPPPAKQRVDLRMRRVVAGRPAALRRRARVGSAGGRRDAAGERHEADCARVRAVLPRARFTVWFAADSPPPPPSPPLPPPLLLLRRRKSNNVLFSAAAAANISAPQFSSTGLRSRLQWRRRPRRRRLHGSMNLTCPTRASRGTVHRVLALALTLRRFIIVCSASASASASAASSVRGRLRLVAAVLAAVELRAALADRRLHDGLEVAEQLAVVPQREEHLPEATQRRAAPPAAAAAAAAPPRPAERSVLVVIVVAWSLARRVSRQAPSQSHDAISHSEEHNTRRRSPLGDPLKPAGRRSIGIEP